MRVTDLRKSALLGGRLNEQGVDMLGPLALAYVGDTVYDLFVRTYLIAHHDLPMHRLNARAISFVKAAAQSDTADRLFSAFTEREAEVFRRGRNAKSAHIPKNASVQDYHAATGLEAVLGYLYLKGETDRLAELLLIIVGTGGENQCPQQS